MASPLLRPFRHTERTGRHQTSQLHAIRNAGNNMEVGIQTAQLLMDNRRHDELKRSIKKSYPLVPDAILDSCIDIIAQAFTTVAPKKLQRALEPGGMIKARPSLEQALVKAVMDQKVIQDIPILQDKEKTLLLAALVNLALDFVLKDANDILQAPQVRLAALQDQVQQVQRQMGLYQLTLYRLRRHRGTAATLTAAAVLVVTLYVRRHDAAIVAVTAAATRVFGKYIGPCFKCLQKQFK